ncbi:PepSY-associated TM helix domain-containing protein [Candidatus Nitrosacidococcus sp. I8]|uniref:PepSY-associated TM helix domain-containing protein n=1 Tax=Candidatus Nitrosacidococcus sp. I8 TaxID=2942908 RepID=UPI0022280E0A|nr:PepSY-associated TM helix domain-containing protein [Candidatus Nitrosacidococcus sp. I8]CAH9017904.1 hypothetical protein NURINAE_00618 [Candidatus Nitrosacidococcus sp. I8]
MEKVTYQTTYDLPQNDEIILSHQASKQLQSRVTSNQRVTKTLLKAHGYLGILCSLFLFIIVGTGILLGFYQQLRYASAPYKLDSPATHSLSPKTLVEKIHEHYPRYQFTELSLSSNLWHAVVAKAKNADGENQVVFINPATGFIFASQPANHQDWLSFIHSLHHGKPFGLIGKIIVSASGFFLLFLWLMGFVLWWRNPTRGYHWRRKSWKIKLRSLHRGVGLTLGGVIGIMAILGALLNFEKPLSQRLDPLPSIGTVAINQPLKIVQAIEKGQEIYSKDVRLDRIYFPKGKHTWVELRFQDHGKVYLHGDKPIKVILPTSRWIYSLYSFHTWEFLKIGRSWVISILGLITLGLISSGIITYWRKST